jgi:hypothetical protein
MNNSFGRKCPSPDGSGYPFAPAFTSSVRFAWVAQKIGTYSRFPASNTSLHVKGKTILCNADRFP